MFTDKEIIKLHADKKYKKTNGFFKNVHLSHSIIKSGIGGVSVSISTSRNVSLSVAIISMLWLFLRYKFITREITTCRSRIIEGLLNTNFIGNVNVLIKDSIGTGNMWLEYKRDKIDAVYSACLEYLDAAEHRVILAAYSNIDEAFLNQTFRNVRSELERIFRVANDELVQSEIKKAMLDYSTVLDTAECIHLLLDVFSSNSRTGNLAAVEDANNDTEEGK